MKNALIVGGTGPTGPYLVQGMRDRGFVVSILHRGTHENSENPPDIEHIHTDPHFRESIEAAIEGRQFDVVIATYGRIRVVAEALHGKAGQFIAVSGAPAYRGYYNPAANVPAGLPTPVSENATTVQTEAEHRFSFLVANTEQTVFSLHPRATIFRYPYVYGPNQILPREWCVIRRLLDQRPFIILSDGGSAMLTHGFAGNMAHAVLLAVDRPNDAAGQIYNSGDDLQFSIRQVVEIISDEMNQRLEILSIPHDVAYPARGVSLYMTPHHIFVDLHKIRRDLGYADRLSADKALRSTVRWYLQNQPDRGGEIEQRLKDPFDYETEDRLAAIYANAAAMARELDPGAKPFSHPYPHPKHGGSFRDHRNR